MGLLGFGSGFGVGRVVAVADLGCVLGGVGARAGQGLAGIGLADIVTPALSAGAVGQQQDQADGRDQSDPAPWQAGEEGGDHSAASVVTRAGARGIG